MNKKAIETSTIDSLLQSKISVHDTTNNPCRQFKKLKTSIEYFESANTRTKGCPNDSLTNLIALKEYEYAVKLDPKFWQARRNFARKLYDFGIYEKSVEQLSEALKLVSSESNPDLHVMRGEALYKLGKYEEAIKDFDTDIKYMGNTSYVLLLKAKAEWQCGEIEKACEDFNKVVKSNPDSEKEREFINCK